MTMVLTTAPKCQKLKQKVHGSTPVNNYSNVIDQETLKQYT